MGKMATVRRQARTCDSGISRGLVSNQIDLVAYVYSLADTCMVTTSFLSLHCLRRVEQHSQQSDALSMLCASSVRESREMHTADSAGITYLGPHIAPRRALTNHVLSSFEITRSIQTYGKFKCCAIKNTPVNSRKFDQRLAPSAMAKFSKCASRGRLPPVEPAGSTLPRSRRSRSPALPTLSSRRMPLMPNEEVRYPLSLNILVGAGEALLCSA
jgi:hypothetical protein